MEYERFVDVRTKIPDNTRRTLVRVFRKYIEKYFHNDKDIWNRRGEPYIFYKHMFRKFVMQHVDYLERVRDLEEYIIGNRPDQTTIYNSRDIDPNTFTLTPDELREITVFLNKHYHRNVQQEVKTKILKHLNRGYTKEDIARHTLTHPDVVDMILKDGKVPSDILDRLHKELNCNEE